LELPADSDQAFADEIRFIVAVGDRLAVDNLLLYEP
jgi:hypothetical protein